MDVKGVEWTRREDIVHVGKEDVLRRVMPDKGKDLGSMRDAKRRTTILKCL